MTLLRCSQSSPIAASFLLVRWHAQWSFHHCAFQAVQEDIKSIAEALAKNDKKLAYLLFVLLNRLGNIDANEAGTIVKEEFLKRVGE
jgi:hypothetical protein